MQSASEGKERCAIADSSSSYNDKIGKVIAESGHVIIVVLGGKIGVKYRRLLIDGGIATSIGIIVASVGVILGLGEVWVAGAIISSMGILGILVILFWEYVEHVYSVLSSYREIRERLRELLTPSE